MKERGSYKSGLRVGVPGGPLGPRVGWNALRWEEVAGEGREGRGGSEAGPWGPLTVSDGREGEPVTELRGRSPQVWGPQGQEKAQLTREAET